jgi:diguanylate cyclase (GGDEF)-like protein
MFNPFSKSHSAPEPTPSDDEVVDLSEIDLDFAVEEAFRKGTPKVVRPIVTVPAEPDDLRAVELFRELGDAELADFAPLCQSSRVVPGYVLYPAGRINTRVHFVIEGQLRLYRNDGGKRPCGIVDIGQSDGLSSAMSMQPTDHSLIATESSHLLVIDAPAIEKMTRRSHAFARNYAAHVAGYTRGENCLQLGGPQPAGLRRDGYIDPITLLHNQRWLDTMFPRIVERSRLSGEPLSLVAFKVDRLDEIDREAGVKLSRYILEAVGQLMVEHSRPTDLHVFDRQRRLLVVLPESDLDAARVLATRLREHVKTLAVDDLPIPSVTLSIGIVTLAESESGEGLLGRADTLIQKSINAGGNWLNE